MRGIIMSEFKAIASISMLSALLENKGQKREYIDLLIPFVKFCCPTEAHTIIDVNYIQKRLDEECGLKALPLPLIVAILNKIYKAQDTTNQNITRNANDIFTLEKAYDNTIYRKTRTEMQRNVSDVIKALCASINQRKIMQKISEAETSNLLSSFFLTFGLAVLKDPDSLSSITSHNGIDNFYIAQFILEEKEKQSVTFQQLVLVMQGYMAYKAIYIHNVSSKVKNVPNASKYNNVRFFLDCSLIIHLLSFDTDERESVVKELISLIRRNGGKVNIFSHTIDEVYGVLKSFACSPEVANSYSLHNLQVQKLTEDVIMTYADKIEEDLRVKFGIFPFTSDALKIIDAHKDHPLVKCLKDADQIELQLRSYVPQSIRDKKTRKYEFDALSLCEISKMRENSKPPTLEKCRAILVTQSTSLNKCMFELYPDEFIDQVNYCINSNDLTCLLWLLSYDQKSDLPEGFLLSCAHAACELDGEILKRAFSIADALYKKGEMSEAEILTLRSEPSIKKYLFAETKNDPGKMDIDALHRATDSFARERSQTDIENAKADAFQEGKETAQQESIKMLDERDRKILSLEDRIKDLQTAIANKEKIEHQKHLEKKNIVEAKANKYRKVARRTILIILWSILLILFSASVVSIFMTIYSARSTPIPLIPTNIAYVSAAFSIFGFAMQLSDSTNFIKKLSENLSGKVWQMIYSRNMR